MLAIEEMIFAQYEEMNKNRTEEDKNKSFKEIMEEIRRKEEEKRTQLRLKESRGRIW